MRGDPRVTQAHPDGTVHPDGTIIWCGQRVTPVPQDVWEEGPGLRFSRQFIGTSGTAEGRGIKMGASRLRWGCKPGDTSPEGYDPLTANTARLAQAATRERRRALPLSLWYTARNKKTIESRGMT